MKAQILLTTTGAKHLIAKALTETIDFEKTVYIAYGTTNNYLLFHLNIITENLYAAGCNVKGKFNITSKRDKLVILKNKKKVEISDLNITSQDVFIKGANALWYENSKKHAAVAAADQNAGTYGNFYIKAAARGAEVIIPVGHEKLIPYYVNTTQNVDISTGSKIAMLPLFYGKIFTELEAFKTLFDVDAQIILAGGIEDSQGSLGFLIEGDKQKIKEAVNFAEIYNFKTLENKKDFIF